MKKKRTRANLKQQTTEPNRRGESKVEEKLRKQNRTYQNKE